MYKLGYTFDIGPAIVPIDVSGAAATGKRVMARNAQNLNIVVFKGLEAGTDDPVLTLNQWQAVSGGSAAALNVDHYWAKAAVTLVGTTTWSKVAMASGRTVTLTSQAANQGIYVIEINTKDLTDGYDYVSVDTAKAGSTAQLGGILYILADLTVRRDPANLAATLF
jgi:hypothetical protein